MRVSRTRPEIVRAEIDRLIVTGVRFGTVLADAGYGLLAASQKGLSERGFTWAVGTPKHQKVYPDDVRMIFPVSDHGRPRKHSIPDTLSVAVETMLASAGSKKVSRKREFLRTFYNRVSFGMWCPLKRGGHQAIDERQKLAIRLAAEAFSRSFTRRHG